MNNTCSISTDRYLELCRAEELLTFFRDALDSAQPYVDMYAIDSVKRLVHAALDSWDVYYRFGIGIAPQGEAQNECLAS